MTSPFTQLLDPRCTFSAAKLNVFCVTRLRSLPVSKTGHTCAVVPSWSCTIASKHGSDLTDGSVVSMLWTTPP